MSSFQQQHAVVLAQLPRNHHWREPVRSLKLLMVLHGPYRSPPEGQEISSQPALKSSSGFSTQPRQVQMDEEAEQVQ